jgi:hypothetical protein
MIVRVSGVGQWRVSDDTLERLNEVDNRVASAVQAGDEEEFRRALRELVDAATGSGEQVPDDDLVSSDVVIPPPDTSLDEARHLFGGEGLIAG